MQPYTIPHNSNVLEHDLDDVGSWERETEPWLQVRVYFKITSTQTNIYFPQT